VKNEIPAIVLSYNIKTDQVQATGLASHYERNVRVRIKQCSKLLRLLCQWY